MMQETLIYRVLLVLIVLVPLPLGSNRPWAWSLMALWVGGLCLWWAAAVLMGQIRTNVEFKRLRWAAGLFAAVLIWAAFQAAGWTPVPLQHSLWAAMPALPDLVYRGGISLDPGSTMTSLMRLAAYGGIFWLAAHLGRDRSRARMGVLAVAWAGVGYACYGLLVYFSGAEVLLGMEKWAYFNDLTATFVNRNAYGAYAGIGLVICVSLAIQAFRASRHTHGGRAFDLADHVMGGVVPFAVGGVVLSTALLLSHSRGAFLCTGVALATLLLALILSRSIKPKGASLLAAVVLGVGLVVLSVSGDVTVKRLAEDTAQEQEDGRLNTYRLTSQAIMDNPWMGVGLGAFQPAFRIYRDASLAVTAEWEYAHNVHLELAMELGIPATLLLYGAWGMVLLSCVTGLVRRHRDHVYPAIALSTTVLVAVHGAVDFSIQIPAIAATICFLLGIGFAQSWSTRAETEEKSRENR